MAYPATYDDIRTAVIRKVRLDANDADDVARAGQWINEVYSEIAVETKCFQQTATTTVETAGGTFTVDTSILHINEITVTQSGGTAGPPLQEVSLDEIRRYRGYGNAASGPALVYALVGLSQIEFWPNLAVGDTITWDYSYLPTKLSADSDLPALTEPFASNLLEYGAAVKAAEDKRDLAMLGDFQAQKAYWMGEFQKYVNRKPGGQPQAFPTWTSAANYPVSDPSADLPELN